MGKYEQIKFPICRSFPGFGDSLYKACNSIVTPQGVHKRKARAAMGGTKRKAGVFSVLYGPALVRLVCYAWSLQKK
jgi:hypothetical protein